MTEEEARALAARDRELLWLEGVMGLLAAVVSVQVRLCALVCVCAVAKRVIYVCACIHQPSVGGEEEATNRS